MSQMKIKDFSFFGYTSCLIAYDNATEAWKIEVLSNSKHFATINGTLPPFGTKHYLLSEDLGGGNIYLNINACDDENEYNCNDGGCISIEERCDTKFECVDHSDEEDCHMIDIPSSYLKHVPAGGGLIRTLTIH